MVKIEFDWRFADVDGDERGKVFEVFPQVFGDSRGFFCEAYRTGAVAAAPAWFRDMSWVKQVNRSLSSPGVVRGCHAQKGTACQGKLVQAVTGVIYDIITDARPDSSTFGVTHGFVLDSAKQNALWVPRGFLHSFVVPVSADGPALFEYWCDAEYDKASETGVAPMSLLPEYVAGLKDVIENGIDLASRTLVEETFGELVSSFEDTGRLVLSDKDMTAESWDTWSSGVKTEYSRTGKAWYK